MNDKALADVTVLDFSHTKQILVESGFADDGQGESRRRNRSICWLAILLSSSWPRSSQ